MSRLAIPNPRQTITAALLALSLGAVGACSGMNSTQQRTLSGGAGGAAAGAAVGALTGGSAATGAIIGGALGAGGGYLYDKNQKGESPF